MASNFNPQLIAILVAIVVAIIILAIGLAVVKAMWTGEINLASLLSEPAKPGAPQDDGKASLSRFQFLVFTFVIAGLYLVLSLETGTLIDVPQSALVLLGISSLTYVASKAMQNNAPKTDDKKKPGTSNQGNEEQQNIPVSGDQQQN